MTTVLAVQQGMASVDPAATGQSTAELKAKLGSPSGRAFNDGSMHGVSRALDSGSVQLGRCIQGVRSMKSA
jgi:hypothetical protein